MNEPKKVAFSSPEALIIYLEADHCLRTCSTSAMHVLPLNQPEVIAFFAMQAKSWKEFIDEFVRKEESRIIPAPTGLKLV